MEIRTRRVVRRYVSTDTGISCKRPQVFNRDDYYYRRYAQHRQPEDRHRSTHRIIETREPLRTRTNLSNLWRRDDSPVRSQPFRMRLPFVRRVPSREDDYETKPRGRVRSPRLFVVDPEPNVRYAWPRSERPRSPSPEIRCVSPRRRPSPRSSSPISLRREEETTIIDDTRRRSRSRERTSGPRPPRERTPVVEREPIRRRPSSILVHQSPERRTRSSSSGRRQVRFSEDVEYVENRNRPRYENRRLESDDSSREEYRSRLHRRRGSKDVDDRPRYRPLSPEGPTYLTAELPRLRRAEDTVISEGRLRPRIIQDGYRDISEAGDRIYAEGRRRRGQDREYHDVVSHSSSRWRRRYDDSSDSSSEDESYRRSTRSRRYGSRWL
ncbi:hypothetical protein BJY04DRAFT_219231 [Aspergillus karnatakaensis]|uniref:putative RNA binding protein n=1 Tax=Aspergillus karnatakaensis TaxID=1810916 RepID=UPI003CCE43CF